MSIDAMKQALEALELLARYENPETKIQVRKPRDGGSIVTMYPHKVASEAATALRAAIEQAEKQEPHSLLCVCGAEWDIYPDGKEVLASTAPRRWQGLTKDEVDEWELPDLPTVFEFAKFIEAKLKEKNR